MIVDPKESFYTGCGITIIVEYSNKKIFAKNIYVSDEQEITLDSIYQLAKEKSHNDKSLIITVMVEYPLQGTVYRYGNKSGWEEIGSLIGYA